MVKTRRRCSVESGVDRAIDAINNDVGGARGVRAGQQRGVGSRKRSSTALHSLECDTRLGLRGEDGNNAQGGRDGQGGPREQRSKRAKEAVKVEGGAKQGCGSGSEMRGGDGKWNTVRQDACRTDADVEGAALPLVEDGVIDGKCGKENLGRVALGIQTAQDGLVIHKRMSVQRSRQSLVEKASEIGYGQVCRPRRGAGEGNGMGNGVERSGQVGKETRGKGSEEALGTARSASPDNVLALQTLTTMPTALTGPTGSVPGLGHTGQLKKKRTHRTRSRVAALGSGEGHPLHASQQPAPMINSLPDDCLRQIFLYSVTDEERSSVLPKRNPLLSSLPLVCKKWREILDSPDEAWSSMVIDLSTSLDYPGMQRFMERRMPAIRHVTLTNEKRIIRTTAQRDNWVTLLSSLDEAITSKWESLRIENARVYELIDFFLLDRSAGTGAGMEPTRLANLKSLDLSGLSTLPKRFTQLMTELPNLQHVHLSFDALVTDGVPAFDGCEPGELPEALFDPRLKSLRIRCKYITSIPELWLNRMVNLEELHLEKMVTKQTFPSLHGLCKLKTLGLAGSTGFFGRDSPDTSSEFSPLVANSLTERMFALFKSIPTLEELVIDWCGIKEIPLAGNRLASPSVKKLSMNNNPDMVFKKGLGLFHGLEHLSMQRCNMPCVSSAVSGLANLKYLDVSNNGLVECNNLGKLKCLETLIAAQNPFPSIPRDVLGMTSLRSIDLSGCVYLEFSSCLEHLMDAWPNLLRLDLRKAPGGARQAVRWQCSSQNWLEKLKTAWDRAHIEF